MHGTSRVSVCCQRSRQPACFPPSLLPTCMAAVTFSNARQGLFRELNPGPPAPEAGIMPLDQIASCFFFLYTSQTQKTSKVTASRYPENAWSSCIMANPFPVKRFFVQCCLFVRRAATGRPRQAQNEAEHRQTQGDTPRHRTTQHDTD